MKMLQLMVIVVALGGTVAVRDKEEPLGGEYCRWQSFNASCPGNSVILMTKAHYGRMRIGKCMTRDYLIGCYADVIKEVDDRCGGRRQCAVGIPDPKLDEIQPCPNDLGAYLEASYDCVEAQTKIREACHSFRPITVDTSSGYLASIVTVETGYGSLQCPWRIQVSPGRRVNVTLYDFGTTYNQQQKDRTKCLVYGKIKEPGIHGEATVCGDTARRKHVYTSAGNELQISLEIASSRDLHQHFIFRYEAVGCATPAPPVGGWVQRDGDNVAIGCNRTTKIWHLVCQGADWVGKYGNCTAGNSGGVLGQVFSDDGGFPFGLVVSIVIGVVLGVIIGVTLLGVVLACRKRKHRRARDAAMMFQHPFGPGVHDSGYGGSTVQKWGPGAHGAQQYSSYAHIWELKQPQGQATEYRQAPHPLDNRPAAIPPREGVTVSSGALSRCQSRAKEHIYESPKFERKESGESFGDPPFYHEFDADEPHEGQGHCVNGSSNQHAPTRVHRYNIEESRYSS